MRLTTDGLFEVIMDGNWVGIVDGTMLGTFDGLFEGLYSFETWQNELKNIVSFRMNRRR